MKRNMTIFKTDSMMVSNSTDHFKLVSSHSQPLHKFFIKPFFDVDVSGR